MRFDSRSRVLVAGGAGFLGSHFVDRMVTEGFAVVVVDNFSSGRRLNLRRALNTGDVTVIDGSINSLPEFSLPIDYVVNFACLASPVWYMRYPVETLESGSTGVRNLIDFAVQQSARLVQISTSEVYGDALIHPQPESYWGNVNPVGSRSVYDESKRFAEALVEAHRREGNLDSCIVRVFNTYGPRMRTDDGRAIPRFVADALSGSPLTVSGNGHQTRSFCYVDDLIEGIFCAGMASDIGGPMNLGNPVETEIRKVAKMIVDMTGSESTTTSGPEVEDDPRRRCPDISLAREQLGWTPRVDLSTGLAETIECFRSYTAPAAPEETGGKDEFAPSADR